MACASQADRPKSPVNAGAHQPAVAARFGFNDPKTVVNLGFIAALILSWIPELNGRGCDDSHRRHGLPFSEPYSCLRRDTVAWPSSLNPASTTRRPRSRNRRESRAEHDWAASRLVQTFSSTGHDV